VSHTELSDCIFRVTQKLEYCAQKLYNVATSAEEHGSGHAGSNGHRKRSASPALPQHTSDSLSLSSTRSPSSAKVLKVNRSVLKVNCSVLKVYRRVLKSPPPPPPPPLPSPPPPPLLPSPPSPPFPPPPPPPTAASASG
jgi:hypothetical protein